MDHRHEVSPLYTVARRTERIIDGLKPALRQDITGDPAVTLSIKALRASSEALTAACDNWLENHLANLTKEAP